MACDKEDGTENVSWRRFNDFLFLQPTTPLLREILNGKKLTEMKSCIRKSVNQPGLTKCAGTLKITLRDVKITWIKLSVVGSEFCCLLTVRN